MALSDEQEIIHSFRFGRVIQHTLIQNILEIFVLCFFLCQNIVLKTWLRNNVLKI